MKPEMRNVFLALLLLFIFAPGCAAPKTAGFSDSNDGIMMSSSSPLMWQKVRGPRFNSWEEADNYAKNLALGGYTDWRLPTKAEFLDFYFAFDYGRANARALGINIEGNYWSAEQDEMGFSGAWKDGDSCEIIRNYQPAAQGYVRAVRP
jgi:hypothetical protein